jgi:preprotein translocase subunit SecF
VRYNLDFIKYRKRFFALSGLITLVGLVTLLVFGLRFGIDFKAGTTMDLSIGKTVTQQDVDSIIRKYGFTDFVTTIGGNQDRVSIRFDHVLSEDQINGINADFASKYGNQVDSTVNTVDPEMAKELLRKAIFAVLLASVGIIIYVSIRFEWRFALSAVLALLHNAFIVISIFSIFQLEVNLPFIVAVLTIIGYSIHDTIVIFDRIRENLRFAKTKTKQDLSDLINNSIRQTLTRSINTVITVLIAAVALFAFGSESIRLFSLAMIIGLIAGAYSSICIASPIWFEMKKGSLGRSK